jgi:hypothetical protein
MLPSTKIMAVKSTIPGDQIKGLFTYMKDFNFPNKFHIVVQRVSNSIPYSVNYGSFEDSSTSSIELLAAQQMHSFVYSGVCV